MAKPSTLVRPLILPEHARPPHAGWTETICPFCKRPVWRTCHEPKKLPPGVIAACAACALHRMTNQRAMDAELAQEN